MRINRFLRLLLPFVLLLTSATARADFGRLYTADQLSSSMIGYMAQDAYGFIWVATQYGLNKFDGYRFTHYFTDRNDTTSIPGNDISRIMADSQHRLWIGSSKGLCRYDYERNCFVRYEFPDTKQPRVECIVEDTDGNLLVGTAGYGLYSIRKGQDRLVHETQLSRSKEKDFFMVLFEDAQHNLWRGYQNEMITRIKVSRLKPTATKDFQSPCGPVVTFLHADARGFLAVCMYGILRYDYLVVPKGSRTLQQVNNSNSKYDLASANVNHIFEDKDHNLWVSCYKKGLYQLNQGKMAFSTWKFAAQNFVLGSSVSSVAPAADAGVWCTVQKSGIYHFDKNGHITPAPVSPAGANCIYRDRQGNYWVGSENTLYSYNPATGASTPRLKVDGWGINCMADDGEGHLFVCNYGKGLYLFNTHTGETRQFSMYQVDAQKGGLCNDWIKALMLDSRGLLWIATSSGVCVMNPATADFRHMGWDLQL